MPAALLRLRPMEESDLGAVVELERQSQYTPWTAGNFRDALAAGNLCLVGTIEQVLVATGVLQMGAAEAELLSMAVLPEYRRRGLGWQLLQELIARATVYGADAIWLEVRVSNLPAIKLYHASGFVDIGWRKGYYETVDGREDAMMMRLAMTAPKRH